MRSPCIQPMSLRHALAIARHLPYLSPITLHEGAVDLKNDLPRHDIELVAPAAMLVAREKAHKALVLLACQAATKENSGPSLINDAGVFPSTDYLELPASSVAQYYFKHGPSLLNRLFPFWLASMIERLIIMLLPLLTLLIPLGRFAPPLYAWRVRQKIYRWYREIRAIDERLFTLHRPEEFKAALDDTGRLNREIHSVTVPLSYMREFYDLCAHLELVQFRIRSRIPAGGSDKT